MKNHDRTDYFYLFRLNDIRLQFRISPKPQVSFIWTQKAPTSKTQLKPRQSSTLRTEPRNS